MMYRKYGKRIFDLVLTFLLLLVLWPLLLLIVILIKIEDRGPVFFSQRRIGRHRVPFRCVKFRTMIEDAADKGTGALTLKDDPRITRVGKYLRAYSLDEFPQLLNVLRGEMSLIGPRPGLSYQVEKYTPVQMRRLQVRPGITGWAQVNGRNSIPWEERIRYDVEYVGKVSLLMDFRILLLTVKTVVLREHQIAARDYFKELDNEST